MPTTRTNGIETYYEDRGEGPPIVFVHAAVLDHAQWAPQTDVLGRTHRTLAYDVRGHGHTGPSSTPTYAIELFADDLAALVDALGLDRPVVCGTSAGGCIAQVFAQRHPDALSGLVLASTFSPPYLSLGERIQRSLMLRAAVPLVRLLGYERVERWLVWIHERLSGPGVSGDYDQVEALRASGRPMQTDEFAKVIQAVAAFHEVPVDLSAIAVPTLVLYGEHEPAFVRRQSRRLAAEIPDARLEELPGAGHASNLDAPEAFNRLLLGFLDEHGIPPAPSTFPGDA